MAKKIINEDINDEIREVLIEEGAEDIYKCYQCGKCTSICPWFQVDMYNFPVYRFSLETSMGMVASSEDKDELAAEIDKIYRCVGCDACVTQCPHGIDTPSILRAARRLLVDFGSYPETLKSTAQKIKNVGNPLGEPAEKRADWAIDLNVPKFQEGMDHLYFPCCLPAYDSRIQNVAKATAKILQQYDISFGILGEKERCCGEAIRKVGAEKVFTEVCKTNIKEFSGSGVKNVLVSSPHCFTTFKNEYPEFGADFETLHITQFLSKLIDEGTIKPSKEFNKKVVYHDPCTLGRKNGVYEEPRNCLKCIPGLELLEVEEFNRNLSVCCGAGSGGLWMEWEKNERIADVRLKQLIDTGADIIAVACPYCLQMFEETLKSMNLEIQVLDVTEILYESL
ncbi:MAG: Fe-S oxidoreductase [Candidatus Cloacimonadota bacterium]|nr:MAG: Fe-S oxidoreductase [Candidatus Cloacimonadota bacterium]